MTSFADDPSSSDGFRSELDDLIEAPSWYGEVDERAAAGRFRGCLSEDWSSHLVGKTLGHFRIVRELGRGAMGVVFLAEAESGDFVARDNVAIKVLRPDIKSSASAIKRFQREARLLADLDSPAITQLFEVSEDQGLMFFAMEYIPGISLQQLIRERGSLAEGDALRLIQQVAIGLACLHNRGVIHRDVKPSNILIDTEKLSSHDQSTSHEIALGAVKLTDLGLARMIRSVESIELTHTNAVVGTPRYMAPEILAPELFSGEKRATPAADLYSLGATLFEMLTGRPPLEANSLIGLADEHLYARPPQLDAIVAGVSKPVSQLVAKMLAKVQLIDLSTYTIFLLCLKRSWRVSRHGWKRLDSFANRKARHH